MIRTKKLALFLFLFLLPWFVFSSLLKIYFIDVYNGDSIFIITPNNKTILIDAGDKSKYYDCGRYVYNFIRKLKIKKIDVVVASHPHRDHIGGLEYILSNVSVNNFYDPMIPYPSDIYKKILMIIDKKKISYYMCRENTKIELDPEIEIVVLHPPKNCLLKSLNDNSIVLRIRYKNFSALFTGDIEKKAEYEIVKKYINSKHLISSDLIKVPHHGSKTSSTESFLQLISPKVAVVTSGRSTKVKHLDKEVVSRYRKLGIDIYFTSKDGTIEVISDGVNYKVNKIKR